MTSTVLSGALSTSADSLPIPAHKLSLSLQVQDWPTVSRPVRLGVGTPLGPTRRYEFSLLTFTFLLLRVGCPLWGEKGSVICSVITHRLESYRDHNHTLLFHLRLPQPGGQGPVFISRKCWNWVDTTLLRQGHYYTCNTLQTRPPHQNVPQQTLSTTLQ
jgi:hypothetical protein